MLSKTHAKHTIKASRPKAHCGGHPTIKHANHHPMRTWLRVELVLEPDSICGLQLQLDLHSTAHNSQHATQPTAHTRNHMCIRGKAHLLIHPAAGLKSLHDTLDVSFWRLGCTQRGHHKLLDPLGAARGSLGQHCSTQQVTIAAASVVDNH